MKMYRIVEELERQGVQPTYANIANFAVFASDEGLARRLKLNEESEKEITWLKELF